MTQGSLIPALPKSIVERELITEFIFFETLTTPAVPDQCKKAFYNRLPNRPGYPSFGLAATSWTGFLAEKVHAGLVDVNGIVSLTLIGKEHLDGLRDEASLEGISLP